MTRYFAQNTPRAGLEHMMMSVPGFQKRGGGMMILSRFCYKPEDVDCRYCLHYRRRSCQVRTCPYIAERLKSGAIEYLDLILEYFGHIPHAGLHKRIQAVEHWSGPDQAVLHTVSVHLRSRFADRVWDDAPPGYLAALYLLASKERLWQPALSALSHDSIDFSCIVSKPHGFAIQDYDKAEEWKALLSKYAMEMAEAMKIPWEDFRWYAAFHDEAHHPHIHMVCYSADPSKGFLTTQGIAQIKSGLAKEIFRQELTELYQKQTQSRNTLNEDARSVLEQLIEQMWSGAVVNHRMEKLMEHLAERLRHTGGRKQYGYLKAPLKAVVDEIVDELTKEPCIAAAYALWYELREDVLRTYKDDLPPRLPLSQQKEFKRIKNIVIEEAVTLGARQQVFHPDDQQDRVPVKDQEEAPLPEAPQPDNDWNDFSESPPDDVPDKTVSAPAKAQMNWSDEYRLARRCLFGGKDQPQDLEQAFTLFQQEAQKGNALAMHDLGRMLADGLGRKIDMQAAHVWYSKALAAFYAVERQKKKRYTEYRIGKLYAAGLGCEQDYP